MKFNNLCLLAYGTKVSNQGVYYGRLLVVNKILLGNWRVHRWGDSVLMDLFNCIAHGCEHGSERFCSMQGGELLDMLSDHWFLKKGCAPWHRRKSSEDRRARKGQHNSHQQFSLVGCWSL